MCSRGVGGISRESRRDGRENMSRDLGKYTFFVAVVILLYSHIRVKANTLNTWVYILHILVIHR